MRHSRPCLRRDAGHPEDAQAGHDRGDSGLEKRRPPVTALVVDASVAAAWILPDEHSESAEALKIEIAERSMLVPHALVG